MQNIIEIMKVLRMKAKVRIFRIDKFVTMKIMERKSLLLKTWRALSNKNKKKNDEL